jgi:hypothetical protein
LSANDRHAVANDRTAIHQRFAVSAPRVIEVRDRGVSHDERQLQKGHFEARIYQPNFAANADKYGWWN